MDLMFDTHVAVAGGGPAGLGAAIAAGRNGVDTVLLEGHGYLGGSRTAAAVDTFYGFWTPGEDTRQVVGGVGFEIAAELISDGRAFKRDNTYGAGPGVTYDIEYLKLLLDRLVVNAAVQTIFHTIVTSARFDGEGWELEVASRTAGRNLARCRYLIDATGDATVTANAGYPVVRAAIEGEVQSLTTIFFMAGVDIDRALSVSHAERSAMIAEADLSGAYSLPRHEGSLHRTPHPGVLQANVVRIPNVDPADPFALSRAEMEGRNQAFEYLRFFRDRLAGCDNAYISALGQQIGIRETRRIRGVYTLTEDDVVEGRLPDDTVALCAAPIEDHLPGSDTRWRHVGGTGFYGIPFRCLIPRDSTNLLVPGRSLSATHAAQASVRNSAQAFATGEAAGMAAALASQQHGHVAELDVTEVQKMIEKNGGILR